MATFAKTRVVAAETTVAYKPKVLPGWLFTESLPALGLDDLHSTSFLCLKHYSHGEVKCLSPTAPSAFIMA